MNEEVRHGQPRGRRHEQLGGFEQRVEAGPHVFKSDEPLSAGGSDAGPNPYDLLLAALGSCTSMTVGLYRRVERIERHIELTGPLDAAQRSRLIAIAERCPVHQTLTARIEIHTPAPDSGRSPRGR